MSGPWGWRVKRKGLRQRRADARVIGCRRHLLGAHHGGVKLDRHRGDGGDGLRAIGGRHNGHVEVRHRGERDALWRVHASAQHISQRGVNRQAVTSPVAQTALGANRHHRARTADCQLGGRIKPQGSREGRLLHGLVKLKAQFGLRIGVGRPGDRGRTPQLRPAQQQRGGERASANQQQYDYGGEDDGHAAGRKAFF